MSNGDARTALKKILLLTEPVLMALKTDETICVEASKFEKNTRFIWRQFRYSREVNPAVVALELPYCNEASPNECCIASRREMSFNFSLSQELWEM